MKKDIKILEVGRGPLTKKISEKYNIVTTIGYPITDSEIANMNFVPVTNTEIPENLSKVAIYIQILFSISCTI